MLTLRTHSLEYLCDQHQSWLYEVSRLFDLQFRFL
jgi:hypothetical protein